MSSPPAGDPELSRRELLVGGGGVTLVCGLGGSPVPTATWYHNVKNVKNAYGQVIEDDQRAWVFNRNQITM